MKNLKALVVAVLVATGTTFATSNPVKFKNPTSISEQVGELLKDPSFKVQEDVTAKVTLMVNSNKELVVLDVETESDQIEDFIKDRLNYEKLITEKSGEQIVLPVRIVPGE